MRSSEKTVEAPYKTCSCGTGIDRHTWGALRYVGVVEDDVERLEMRQCDHCSSTITMPLEA